MKRSRRSLSEVRDRGWARLQAGELELLNKEEMGRYAFYDGSSERQTRPLI